MPDDAATVAGALGCRQRRATTPAGRRARRNRAGDFAARHGLTVVGGIRRVEAAANSSNLERARQISARAATSRPGKRDEATRSATFGYSLTHTKYVEFEINHSRVNKVLRIARIDRQTDGRCHFFATAGGAASVSKEPKRNSNSVTTIPAPARATGARNARKFALRGHRNTFRRCRLVSLTICCGPLCGPTGAIMTPSSAS